MLQKLFPNTYPFQRSIIIVKMIENGALAWITGIYVLYILKYGITVEHAMWLNMVYTGTISLFDPKTGALGDRYGHRTVYLWGAIMHGIAVVLYAAGDNWWWFAGAELLAGIAYSLSSEALESWYKNFLEKEFDKDYGDFVYTKVMASTKWRGTILAIPFALIGSWSYTQVDITWPWWLSCGGFTALAVASYYLLGLNHEVHSAKPEETEYEELGWAKALTILWRNKILQQMTVILAVTALCYQPFNMLWSILFVRWSGSEVWLGAMVVPMSFGMAIGQKLTSRIAPRVVYVYLGIAIVALAILTTLWSPWWIVGILPFTIHEVARGYVKQFCRVKVQTTIVKSQNRAELASMVGALGTIGSFLGLLLTGWLSRIIPIELIWIVSCLALAALVLMHFKQK